MGDQTDHSFFSLAHPLYASTEEIDESPPVLAFPGIGSGWDGASLSHLRWVGYNKELVKEPPNKRKSRVLEHLARVHLHEEQGHGFLSESVLSKMSRKKRLELWLEIRALSEGEACYLQDGQVSEKVRLNDRVPVPLLVEPTGRVFSLLEYKWQQVSQLSRTAAPVEEVYAVWQSLKQAKGEGLLSERQRERLASKYKNKYSSAGIPTFSGLYDDFHEVAEQIGVEAAYILAFESLNTPQPERALKDMLSKVGKLLDQGMSLNDADMVIHICTAIVESYSSPCYNSMREDYLEALHQQGVFRRIQRQAYWRRVRQGPLAFQFDNEGLEFYPEPGDDLSRGQFSNQFWYMFGMESILHQLVTGIGMLCPFRYIRVKTGKCCKWRHMLQGILEHVEGPKETWYAQGCLKE